MKCTICGNTEVGMYKEVRSLIAEMGITKEDIQKEIKSTIDSYIRSAMSENITNYIQESVKTIIQKEIANSSWNKPSKVQEVLRECLKDLVMEELTQLSISVSVTDKSDN